MYQMANSLSAFSEDAPYIFIIWYSSVILQNYYLVMSFVICSDVFCDMNKVEFCFLSQFISE